jgi:hypothetical protein
MTNFKKLTKSEVDASGTSLSGYLHNTTYHQLCEAFGEPTYLPEDSGDGKVNFEWVFEFNGDIFTVYDWKTYDKEYTMNQLTTWNIGSKAYYGEFSDHIESILKSTK